MPFKSKAQMRKIAMLERQGKLPPDTYRKWLQHTPHPSRLPNRVRRRKR
jgi:hypothetical protein